MWSPRVTVTYVVKFHLQLGQLQASFYYLGWLAYLTDLGDAAKTLKILYHIGLGRK